MRLVSLVSVVSSLALALPCAAQDQAGKKEIRNNEKAEKTAAHQLSKTVKKVQAIDINSASAETIAETLGIDQKVAEAVVARRTKLGPLESTDDLLVVPGVSRKAVTANFARLGLPQGTIKLDVKPAQDAAARTGKTAGAPTTKTDVAADQAKPATGKPIKK